MGHRSISLQRYEQVKTRFARGQSLRQIAAACGLDTKLELMTEIRRRPHVGLIRVGYENLLPPPHLTRSAHCLWDDDITLDDGVRVARLNNRGMKAGDDVVLDDIPVRHRRVRRVEALGTDEDPIESR